MPQLNITMTYLFGYLPSPIREVARKLVFRLQKILFRWASMFRPASQTKRT